MTAFTGTDSQCTMSKYGGYRAYPSTTVIPVYYPAGGGDGAGVVALSLIGTIVGLMFVSSRFGNRPSLQLKLVHRMGTDVTIMLRTTKLANSNPRIIIRNLQALQDKGYYIGSLHPDKKYNSFDIKRDWITLGSIKTDKSLEEFRKDCKEGAVYAEFHAEYDTNFMDKEVTTRQTRYWYSNITPELGSTSVPQLK